MVDGSEGDFALHQRFDDGRCEYSIPCEVLVCVSRFALC